MKNGLDILLSTYWSSKGWKDGTISEEDFQLLKSKDICLIIPSMRLMKIH